MMSGNQEIAALSTNRTRFGYVSLTSTTFSLVTVAVRMMAMIDEALPEFTEIDGWLFLAIDRDRDTGAMATYSPRSTAALR